MLDRVIGLRRRRAREDKARGASEAADPMQALEARVTHLESMIEGLQDAVHRETKRTHEELEELRKQIEPAEISKALSRHARERGL